MDDRTLRQLHGGIELASDGVEAVTTAAAQVHLEIAAKPYAVLGHFRVIAAPVRRIEQVQMAITRGVYCAVSIGNQVVRHAAVRFVQRRAHGKQPPQDAASH